MSATTAAVTSEQDLTCDDIIHAKVDSKCTEQQLAVHARRSQSVCVQKCRILAVLDAQKTAFSNAILHVMIHL